jgi:3'-phosphoadenosine 5'-phosphosulfate sulfotransferase (PAPS reductase)/FAD synthetase
VQLKESGGEILMAGGSVDKTKRPWEIRFHLGRGADYMKWRVENKPKKEVNFYDPEEVQIHMYNCKLTNQVKTAEKIYKGEINKRPIAWIKCVDAEVKTDIVPVDFDDKISYNPRKSPNWLNEKGEILDNHVFEKLITYGRSVYYDDGEQLYKIGGLIESDFYEEGGNVEKRYYFQADGYIYAKSDDEAKKKTEEVRDKMDEVADWPSINHLHQNDSGSRYSREVFAGGGSVLKLTKAEKQKRKKLKDRIKRETNRLKEFKKELKKTPNLAIGIATSVFQHHDIEGEKRQEDQLVSWMKNPENDVKIIVAFSGGKDSVAIVLHLFELGFEPDQIELWHHLVDGKGENLWDWPCTESYCQAFADHYGLKLLFSYRDGGITREIYRECELTQGIYYQDEPGGEYIYLPSIYRKKYIQTRHKFPAVSADLESRWCSSSAKISVMSRAINNMERFKNANIVICTGERRKESNARAKYVAMEPYRSNTISRTAIQWRPVINLDNDEVWEQLEDHKIQPHPAYELGWGRCSCQICIFSSPGAWASNNELSPEKINRIADIENEIGHTLRHEKVGNKIQKLPIKEYMKDGKSFLDPELVAKWKPQLIGEFTLPIKVKNWKLPPGADSLEDCGAN